ncbi:hypothetical protein Vadar_015188 [Vaccinium darrowii]|uniref:Uncharacterized protein n=1 Tax=Vaccinium darrowii TaxID=229202 RepID=A0ACB7XZX6_9ERIC|nr:hypothetical protein Vadar_015188 [Vaccinium darrowii]
MSTAAHLGRMSALPKPKPKEHYGASTAGVGATQAKLSQASKMRSGATKALPTYMPKNKKIFLRSLHEGWHRAPPREQRLVWKCLRIAAMRKSFASDVHIVVYLKSLMEIKKDGITWGKEEEIGSAMKSWSNQVQGLIAPSSLFFLQNCFSHPRSIV